MTAAAVEIDRIRPPLIEALAERLELPADDAGGTVDHLIRAEQAGKKSHGLIRVVYVTTSGKFGPNGGASAPAPSRRGPGRLHVDGRGHFGYALLTRIVEAGCAEARDHGTCVVTGSPVYPSGALGDWARQAAERGCGLWLVANSPRRVAPPGGRHPVVGTNALCIGLPTEPVSFVADLATSAIPHGALLVARAGGKELPPRSAIDSEGRETTSASQVDPTKGLGALLPFGGSHKAFALAMGIELLACLGDGEPGRIEAGRHGVFALFLGPAMLKERVATLSRWLAALEGDGTHIPGWQSGRRLARQRERGVVEVPSETLDALTTAGVLPPDFRTLQGDET